MDIVKILLNSKLGKKVVSKILTNLLNEKLKSKDISVKVHDFSAEHKAASSTIDLHASVEMKNDALLKILYDNLK